MNATEARRIVARHGDTIPAPDWPPAPDETVETLRDMGCPTTRPAVRRAS